MFSHEIFGAVRVLTTSRYRRVASATRRSCRRCHYTMGWCEDLDDCWENLGGI